MHCYDNMMTAAALNSRLVNELSWNRWYKICFLCVCMLFLFFTVNNPHFDCDVQLNNHTDTKG